MALDTPTTFGLAGATLRATAFGSLTAVQVDRVDSTHPNAPANLHTGRHWLLTPTGGDFVVDLTLSTSFWPDTHDSLCRYDGAAWDCAASSFTYSSITRRGVTHLSAWAAANQPPLGPPFQLWLPVADKDNAP